MTKPFHFKNFTVAQDRCAMKVGTDGVLLGAWAKAPEDVKAILDIGTGTGVIALMMAQRFASAEVVGIDIAKSAITQAEINFKKSIFSERLKVVHSNFQDFKYPYKFDCIVSNPPFFSHGILPKTTDRELARHTTTFSFRNLFEKVFRLLTPNGIFSMIVPLEMKDNLVCLAEQRELFCNTISLVFPNPTKHPKRVLMSFSLQKLEFIEEELTIETEIRHRYTENYKKLLKDFYLAF